MKLFTLIKEIPIFIFDSIQYPITTGRSKLAQYLRKRPYHSMCYIGRHVFVSNKKNFTIGRNSALYESTYIDNENGVFILGNKSHLGNSCYVNVVFGKIEIGDGVAIGPGCKIIAYSNDYKKDQECVELKAIGEIMIGDNVFIGANVTILPGAIIEDNVVVGAGAVVKGRLVSGNVYGGVIAKILKEIV